MNRFRLRILQQSVLAEFLPNPTLLVAAEGRIVVGYKGSVDRDTTGFKCGTHAESTVNVFGVDGC
jgi:hypothetical protein